MANWWDIGSPAIIKNRPDDFVTYDVKRNGKKKDEPTVVQENVACYYSEMPHLRTAEFQLKPKKGAKSFLPGQYYHRWIELGKQCGVVPSAVRHWTSERRNLMAIPADGYDRHTVYATLCWYRWAENFAKFPVAVMKLMDANPAINFWQAFHYAAIHHVSHSNHSFMNIGAYGVYGGMVKNARNLLKSYAIMLFFQRDEKGECPARKYDDGAAYTYTQSAISRFLGDLGLNDVEPPLVAGKETPIFCVAKTEDLLWDEWAGFYSLKSRNPDELATYYKAVMERKACGSARAA